MKDAQQTSVAALMSAVVVAAFLAVCSLAVPSFAATSKAPPAGRVTFGVEPAESGGANPRPDFDFGVTDGAVTSNRVAVLNFSKQPLTLQVYATDAVETSTGGFGLLPASAKPTGVGSWVTLPRSASSVRVPAEHGSHPGVVVIPFTLKVPDTASPGDHVGGIVASLRTFGKNSTGQNIVLYQRVGSRLFVRVVGTLAPHIAVSNVHITYHGSWNPIGDGRATVHYLVSNPGNLEVALNQKVTVSGWFGSKHSLVVPQIPLLLPGSKVQETANFAHVWPAIRLRAKVLADPVAASGDTDPHLSPISATASTWAIPWLLLLIILLVVGGGRGWLVLRARSRSNAISNSQSGSASSAQGRHRS